MDSSLSSLLLGRNHCFTEQQTAPCLLQLLRVSELPALAPAAHPPRPGPLGHTHVQPCAPTLACPKPHGPVREWGRQQPGGIGVGRLCHPWSLKGCGEQTLKGVLWWDEAETLGRTQERGSFWGEGQCTKSPLGTWATATCRCRIY